MQKTLLLLILSTLLIKNGFTQNTPISLSIGGNYAFGINKNSVETFVNTKQEGNEYYSENKKFSLGYGYSINGNILYSFHENMGISLGFNYHFPKDVEFNEINEVAGIRADKQRLLSAKRFALLPAFQLNTAFDKLNTYIRVGISLNFTSQKLHEITTIDTMVSQYFWEYSGNSGIGYFAEWGLTYSINEHFSLGFHVAIEAYSYTPDKCDMVSSKLNDKNYGLDNFQKIEKSIVFEDWVSDQYSQYPDADKPLKVPKQTFNYNNLSLGLSMIYHF